VASDDQLLDIARNLARYHREHEKFYARAPLEEAPLFFPHAKGAVTGIVGAAGGWAASSHRWCWES